MTSISLSVALVPYRPTAENAPARDIAPPDAVPKADPPSDRDAHRYGRSDTPRHSPLYRALMEALDGVVGSAQAAGVKAADAAMPATEDAPVDLEQAVMSFARALMQVMRGVQDSEGGAKGDGHGHRIHQHHRHHDPMAWGGPSQRVEQLGVKLGAVSETQVPAEATAPILAPAQAAAASAVTEVAGTVDALAEPAIAIPTAPDAAASTMVYVKFSIDNLAPWSAAADRAEQRLVNAFGTLRKALGADESDDRPSLREQLSAFLQALADKLRTGEDDGHDSTRPGALLDITA